MFEQELNKILRSWQPSILPDGNAILTCVDNGIVTFTVLQYVKYIQEVIEVAM